jgi:V/A-type H+-transporting ATPase subunit I
MRIEMARLEIVGLKSQLQPVVETLYRLGCVQIDPLAESGGPAARPLHLDRDAVRAQEELAFLLARIEGLQATLALAAGPGPAGSPEPSADCAAEARRWLEGLGPQVQTLVARREALEAEQASLPRYEATLRKLLPIVPASARDPGNVSIGVLMSRSHVALLDSLAERVLDLSAGRAEIASADVDSASRAMLLVVPRDIAPRVEELLGREDISRLRLPRDFAGQPPDAAVAALGRRLAAIPAELAGLHSELAALAREWGPRLETARSGLRVQLDSYAVLARLGETEQTFVLAGWTPAREVARVQAALARAGGELVVVRAVAAGHADAARAPVALTNPAPARPFQSLVRLLGMPRYDGIDPTPLMALFMPLFFGMTLGDIGYGALLLLIALAALRSPRLRAPGALHDIVVVLAQGSAWAILFGLLYGEAFGSLGEHFGLHALWLDRADPDQVSGLLLFAIAVGVVHVTLGLLLGLWEGWRHRSRAHLLERGGMLIGLIGLFQIAATAANYLPAGFITPGIAALIVGIVLLSASFGQLLIAVAAGPIEFIGLIGNILSYLRIAAIGLASLYLARVANELGANAGQVNVVLGVIIAVLIHALNLVMGAFSPTIHSLRLHYVEFFRKFYETGGRPFEPFGTAR